MHVLICLLMLWNYVSAGILTPDFDSGWMPMRARNPGQSREEVHHGFGEVPILVDVQVQSLDEPNLDFIFPGVGCRPRDDDDATEFGGVVYVYNNESVVVSVPYSSVQSNSGFAIYTGEGTYYTGLNQQSSLQVRVRVRAWRASSLPSPDFHKDGLMLRAGSSNVNDVYIEESHGLGDYPILARVRTRLTDGDFEGWYSDAVGSSMAVYPNSAYWWPAHVIYGYNDQDFRVWAPSKANGRLFDGADGYRIEGEALTGETELFAWTKDTLGYTYILKAQIGPGFTNELKEFKYGYNFSSDMYLVTDILATGGPNLGYRFPGSGALAYSTAVTDPVCSYGGLTYAYTTSAVRFWRPEPVTNGGLICIASVYGTGVNKQVDPHGVTVTTLWASSWEVVTPPPPPVTLKAAPEWVPIESKCIEKDL